MTHAIELPPELFRVLARDGASEIELARLLRRARERRRSPPAWAGILRDLFNETE